MPLLRSTVKQDKIPIRITIEQDLKAEIEAYCHWANVEKMEDFFQQAAEIILQKDRAWASQKEEIKNVKLPQTKD